MSLELLGTMPMPDPHGVLYGLQAAVYVTVAATPAAAMNHHRLAICHGVSAAIYFGFAIAHFLHV